jgi:hypothetical protein
MKKVYLMMLPVLSILMAACSCSVDKGGFSFGKESIIGNKVEVREVRKLVAFSKIDLEGVANVYYAQSDSFKVIVKGDQNIVPHVLTEVEGGKLHIDMDSKFNLRPSKKVTILVYSPTLTDLDLEGVGSFYVPGKVNFNDLSIDLEGVGSIHFMDSLIANTVKVDLEGVGKFKAPKLNCRTVDITLEGVGGATLGGITQNLKSERDGVGKINTSGLKVLRNTTTGDE